MHLDPVALAIVKRVMLEFIELEVGAEFAVDPFQQVEIECSGDALRVVIGPAQNLGVLHQIDADDKNSPRAQYLPGMAQKFGGLMGLKIADGRTRKETAMRQ